MEETRKKIYGMVGISAALHFLVDGLCLCTLYLMSPYYDSWNLTGIFMTYNVLAFLTQILTGHLADISRQKHWMLIISLFLLILGVASMAITLDSTTHSSVAEMLPTATLLGMGNSFFHTWGGKQVAMKTDNDIRALGFFVSTGAFGLSVSIVFHSWALLYGILLASCVLAGTYLILDLKVEPSNNQTALCEEEQAAPHPMLLAVCAAITALMLLVMLRSWVGESFTAVIGKSEMTVLAIGATAMLGKMSGGWIARGMGIIKSMVVVLTIVLICLTARDTHYAAALVGLYAVNCTMPVTLYLANEVLRGREGLAFGLLAAALVPGYLLAIL